MTNQRPLPNNNSSPSIALPQDVAQQRAAQAQAQHAIMQVKLNVAAGVLGQLIGSNDPANSKWIRQRPDESDQSHQARVRESCDRTADLAIQYADSLLVAMGIAERKEEGTDAGSEVGIQDPT